LAVEVSFCNDEACPPKTIKIKRVKKLDWDKKTTCDEYEEHVNNLLATLNSTKVLTANENNIMAALDEFINELNSCLRRAVETTKSTCGRRKTSKHAKSKKWWDDELNYIKEQVNRAYTNYKQSGFLSATLKQNYKTLRAHYRYKQRDKKRKSMKSYQRKLEILYRQNKSEFWKDMKKKRKKVIGVDIQTNELKNSFEELFNKKLVQNKENEKAIEEIGLLVENKLKTIKNSRYEINPLNLEIIIKGLKNNKSIGFGEVSNEMYKYGGHTVLGCVKLILEKIIEYGKIPHLFNIGKIMPIIKNEKEDNDNLNNVRPITISDTLSNIFEKVVIYEIDKVHTDQNLQFGFKRNSSTNYAIFVLKETVNYYNYKKKNVYACAIDASKAFDKVNRIIMAFKLIGKVHPLVWRALVHYYAVSVAYLYNKNEASSIFKTTVGVKQGGPLSPRLFAIYVEDLIVELETSVFGAMIGNTKTGVLMFADDLIVLTESKENLQEMLKIVEKYCLKNEIKINAKKTQFIRFGGFDCQNESQSISLDGHRIKRVDKIEYLGVWIDSKLKSHGHIEEKTVSITNAFNALRNVGITEKDTSVSMKTFLYKVYCRPILFYGIENLTLQKQDIKTIQTTEATLIKYSYNLSKTTRTTQTY